MPSSRTATMPADILLDSAILKVLRGSGTPVSTKVGASRGGLSFNPNREMRQVQYDGQRHRKVGLDRVTGWNPTISGRLLQANADNVQMLEPGSTSAIATVSTVDTQTVTPQGASTMLVEGEYLEDVRLEYRRGNGGTFAIVFPFGLVTQWSLAGQDNDEAQFDVTIEARAEADADDDEAPFYYEITGADIVVTP